MALISGSRLPPASRRGSAIIANENHRTLLDEAQPLANTPPRHRYPWETLRLILPTSRTSPRNGTKVPLRANLGIFKRALPLALGTTTVDMQHNAYDPCDHSTRNFARTC